MKQSIQLSRLNSAIEYMMARRCRAVELARALGVSTRTAFRLIGAIRDARLPWAIIMSERRHGRAGVESIYWIEPQKSISSGEHAV